MMYITDQEIDVVEEVDFQPHESVQRAAIAAGSDCRARKRETVRRTGASTH